MRSGSGCALLLLLLLGLGDSQLCPGDNFLNLTEIQDFNREDLVSLPSAEVPFTEWAFPNSLRFQCDGMITGWVFGAESVNLSTIQRLPQWSIYRDMPLTVTELDFTVEYRTGDRDELAEIQPGLYRYTLKSPVNVSEGDILGIGYSNEPADSRQLQLSFLNVRTETSYRRDFTASLLLVARPRNGVNRFLPVVTPLMASIPATTDAMAMSSTTGSSTTNPVPTLPPQTSMSQTGTSQTTTPQTQTSMPETSTPIPETSTPQTSMPETSMPETSTPQTSTIPLTTAESPTTVNPATSTPTAVSTIATEILTSLEPQTTTEFSESPTTSEPLTTQQPSTTTDQPAPLTEPVATEEEQTSAPTDPSVALPPTASSVKLGVIIGVVAGLLGAVLVMMVMGIVVLIIFKRRKHMFKVNESDTVSPLDNPTYQVNTVTLDEDCKRTTMDPEYATLKSNHKSPQTNGAMLNGRTYMDNYTFGSESPPPAVTRLEMSENSHQFDSSVVYYEVGPSSTEEARAPQDYALPVASKHSTAVESQPYEVPVNSLHHNHSRQVSGEQIEEMRDHDYKELEHGIYVPTIGEREMYLSNDEAPPKEIDNSIYSKFSRKYRDQLHQPRFFLEDEVYWVPASSKRALYDQLARKRYREILRQQIRIHNHLGSGQFGMVHMGEWLHNDGVMRVAVKTLVPQSTDDDKVKFLQEAAIMGQFSHPNVVRLYGVVTVGEPVMIVLEYMKQGDLRNFLLERQPKPGEVVDSSLPHQLLRFCREIADGMDYLSTKSFVHRDLAARNILVGANTTCKIGDFGMSRNLEDSNYYITHGGRIPVKWTAPEALHYRKYSTASDVWSFGAVMYELWGLGRKPFEAYTNAQTIELVMRGYRLPPPPGCPRALYGLMIRCWHSEAGRRPVFSAVKKMLSHSDSQLLSWSSDDLSVHPLVSRLGAPCEVTEDLYQDLQDYYLKKT